MPAPEQHPTQELQSQLSDQLFAAVRTQENYETAVVLPNNPVEIDTKEPLRSAVNESQGISQDLLAVVSAGNSLFGIIKIQVAESEVTKFLVSKLSKETERATIVGIFGEGQTFTVGRSLQPELDDLVSRDHFTMSFVEGKLLLADNDSTNGTEVVQTSGINQEINQSQEPAPFAIKSVRRIINRFGKHAQAGEELQADPLLNLNIWAPKSADVKELIQDTEKEPVSEAHSLLTELVADGHLVAEKERVLAELAASSEMQRIHDLTQADLAAQSKMYAAKRAGNHQEAQKLDAEAMAFYEQLRSLPQEQRKQYDQLMGRLKAVDIYHSRNVEPGSKEAQAVYHMLQEAPKIQPTNKDIAPFKDYINNTDEVWQYIPEQDIKNYLNSRVFFDTTSIHSHQATPNTLAIRAEKAAEFEIPIDLIVYAQGFDSWEGRHGSGKSVNSKYSSLYNRNAKSLDVIKHYASLQSELPPVDEIRVFVQPDGTIFCDNGSGDSHRIGAAMLRGEKTVKAERLSVHVLKDNILSMDTK